MEKDAVERELHRKSCRMRALFFAALDCFVGDKPVVAATTPVATAGVTPARDVTFIRIRNTERETVERCLSLRGEMKNVLVTIIQKPPRIDRLEMFARDFSALILDRDRL